MKFTSNDLRAVMYVSVGDEQVSAFLEDIKEGLNNFNEFKEASTSLALLAQIVYSNPSVKYIKTIIDVINDSLNKTYNQNIISSFYFGLIYLYDKLGDNAKVIEYCLLFENLNFSKKDERVYAMLSVVYTHLACVSEESKLFEQAIFYNEKSRENQKKVTALNTPYYELTYYVNQIYILMKLGNLKTALELCDQMQEIMQEASETPEFLIIKEVCELTSITLSIHLDPTLNAPKYFNYMNSLMKNKKSVSPQTIEPHVEIMVLLAQSGYEEEVYEIGKFVLKNENFTGDRTLLCEQILNIALKNNKDDICPLKDDFIRYLKEKVIYQADFEKYMVLESFEYGKVKKQLSETKELYERDTLTKSYTRNYLDTTFDEFYQKNKEGSLVFLDIDKFKNINDSYGHLVGDETLKKFASTLNDFLPGNYQLFRYGGDEFIILSSDPANVTAIIIDTVCRHFEEPFRFEEVSFKITCSYGIENFSNQTLEQIIEKADKRMYRSKHLK